MDEDAINRFQQEQQDRQYQQDEQSSQAALIDNVKNMTPNERIAFLCDKFGNGGYLDLTEDRIARRFKKCLKETTYDLELGLQPMITKGEKEMLMKIADFKSREDIETMFLSSVCLWEVFSFVPNKKRKIGFSLAFLGFKTTIYAMDLVYTRIYRLYELETFMILVDWKICFNR